MAKEEWNIERKGERKEGRRIASRLNARAIHQAALA